MRNIFALASLCFLTLSGCKSNTDSYSNPLDNPDLNIPEFQATRVARTAKESKEIKQAFGLNPNIALSIDCKYNDFSHLKTGDQFTYFYEERAGDKSLNYSQQINVTSVGGASAPQALETQKLISNIRYKEKQTLTLMPSIQWKEKSTSVSSGVEDPSAKTFFDFVRSFYGSAPAAGEYCEWRMSQGAYEISEGFYTLANGTRIRAIMQKTKGSGLIECSESGSFNQYNMHIKIITHAVKSIIGKCDFDTVANLEYEATSQGYDRLSRYKVFQAPLQ